MTHVPCDDLGLDNEDVGYLFAVEPFTAGDELDGLVDVFEDYHLQGLFICFGEGKKAIRELIFAENGDEPTLVEVLRGSKSTGEESFASLQPQRNFGCYGMRNMRETGASLMQSPEVGSHEYE